MSNSPSGPYKSRIVRGVVQQARRLIDRSQTTIRRAQMLASWSAQILLYPFYAAFQSGRLLGQAVSEPHPDAPPTAPASAPPIAVWQAEAPLTAETPLVRVLESVQALELPAGYAVSVPEPTVIQAIATLLDSRALVLVTNHNQLLLIPDPEQQHWLQQRVVYEIASYYREQRSQSLPLNRAIAALRGVGAAIQRWRLPGRSAGDLPSLPAGSSAPSVSSPLVSDRPVQQFLQAVQQWLTQPAPPTLQWAETPPQFAATERLALPGSVTGELAIAEIPETSLIAATEAAIAASTPTHIRGIVSLLDSRQLALVSVQNEVLDLLTPEQQHRLQQRIAWEVADYYRTLRVQALPPPPTLGARIAGTAVQIQLPPALLPTAQLVQRFVAWMQSGSVAIATNLFHEAPASLPSLSPPSSGVGDASGAEPLTLVPSSPPLTIPFRWRSLWANWLASLGLEAIAPLPSRDPSVPTPPRSLEGLVPAPSQALQASSPTTPIRPVGQAAIAVSPNVAPRDAAPIARPSVSHDGDATIIDTHATAIGYEQSWFERVMGWLDQCFLWVETAIAHVWQRITRDE